MKNKICAFLPFLLLVAFCYSCSTDHCDCADTRAKTFKSHLKIAGPDYHKINFNKFIDVQKNRTLEFHNEEILTDTAFVNVFEHSPVYFDDAMKFLQAGHFNAMQAHVCILAMQNLPVNDYVKLCDLYLSLFNQHKIAEGMLESAIMPNFLNIRVITNNYCDPKVKALLTSIINNKNVSKKEFKNYLSDILSGKACRELLEFDDETKSN